MKKAENGTYEAYFYGFSVLAVFCVSKDNTKKFLAIEKFLRHLSRRKGRESDE